MTKKKYLKILYTNFICNLYVLFLQGKTDGQS